MWGCGDLGMWGLVRLVLTNNLNKRTFDQLERTAIEPLNAKH
jgi:hypothetical protein